MLRLIRENYIFYCFYLPIFIGSSFVVTPAPLAVGLAGVIWFIATKRYDYLIIIFLLTLILANNKAPNFVSYEILRVAFIGVLFFLSVRVMFREKGIDRRIIYFLPFFFTALVSSILFSPNVINSVFKVLSYLVVVATLFSVIKNILRERSFKLYEHILILIFITLSISLLGSFVYPSVFKISGRLNGVLGNPNFLGLFCVLSYALVDNYQSDEYLFEEREILILKILIILTVFLTGSRNSYASLAIYVTGSVFLFRGFTGKSVAIFLVIAAGITFIEIRALTELLPFLNDLVRPETIGTASGRSTVWPVAISEIFRNPWLGGGFEYYSYYMSSFAALHGLKGVFWHGVWNTYLAFLLDTGLVGLLSYFFFIWGVIRMSAQFIIILPFLLMMVFTGMFEAWTVSSLNPVTPFFLLFFVILSIYGSKYEYFNTA